MFSLICVYNNRKILENCLLKSLEEQKADYNLILIDNRENKFNSAAKALNFAAKKASSEYLVFVHQDIRLSKGNWFESTAEIINQIENLGVAGVAGKSQEKKVIIGNVKEGVPPRPAGINIQKPTEVQTIDECLFIIPRKVFDKYQFDEELCDGWHLYGVDYCLTALENGLKVYVIPNEIYHRSTGFSFSNDYFTTLKRLFKKHKDFPVVYTTMETWHRSYPITIQKILPLMYSYWKKLNKQDSKHE